MPASVCLTTRRLCSFGEDCLSGQCVITCRCFPYQGSSQNSSSTARRRSVVICLPVASWGAGSRGYRSSHAVRGGEDALWNRASCWLVGCRKRRSVSRRPMPRWLCDWLYVFGAEGALPLFRWTSKFRRKLAKSNLGGEVYAFSEMVADMSPRRELFAPAADVSPSISGLENRESIFTHLKNKEAIAEKFPIRHFLGIQRSLGS